MTERDDRQQERIWNSLHRQIRRYLALHGVENAFGEGDFWIVSDNYGWRRLTVLVFNLSMMNLGIIASLRRLLSDYPGWEIVVAVDVPEKEGIWPPMGVTIRKHEIIDGLQRQYLPAEFQSLVIPGSRPGTGYD